MSTTLNALTQMEFTNLLDDYFAPPEKRFKMNEEEIKKIAILLDQKIDIPLVRETKEEKILIKIVLKIDTFLYNYLPNELYDLIRSTTVGISDKESKRLIRRLTKLANDRIDIPYIPEFMERVAIRFVISIVLNAARNMMDMDQVTEKLKSVDVPKSKSITDKQLAGIFQI